MRVASLLFFPIPIERDWSTALSKDQLEMILEKINLAPLYFLDFGNLQVTLRWFFRDLFLNIAMTIPLGMGIAYFIKPGLVKALLLALLSGLATEGVQLLLILISGVNYRSVDINDVIANTCGVLIGYGFYWVIKKIFQKMVGGEKRVKGLSPESRLD